MQHSRTYLGAQPALFLCHFAKKTGSLCFFKPHTSCSPSSPLWLFTQEGSRAGRVQLIWTPRLRGQGAMHGFRPMSKCQSFWPQKSSKPLSKTKPANKKKYPWAHWSKLKRIIFKLVSSCYEIKSGEQWLAVSKANELALGGLSHVQSQKNWFPFLHCYEHVGI